MESAPGCGTSRGFVWFVGAGPGDPGLITLRGAQLLRTADVVLHDALIHSAILDEVTGRRIDVGKRCGHHSMRQEKISALLADLAGQDQRIVRLKGGDSGVLGRVAEEALLLTERGIPFEIVPGVSSATAAPSAAGIPLTHRGLADSFVVATAHRRADRRDAGRDFSIPTYSACTTVVLLMASASVGDWSEQLLQSGYPANLPVALISAGCTELERVVETRVARVEDDLRRAGLQTPMLAVVGWVVTLRGQLAGGLARFSPDQNEGRDGVRGAPDRVPAKLEKSRRGGACFRSAS